MCVCLAGLDNDCDGDVDEGGVCTCANNPKWKPVTCTSSTWVYSSSRSYTTTAAASAAHALYTSISSGIDCSLTGMPLGRFSFGACLVGGMQTG